MGQQHKITSEEEMKVTAGDLPHPGTWVRHNVLEPFGLSVAEAARRISFNRVTLSRVLSGEHALSRDLAYRLEALTGVSADLMINLQAGYEAGLDRPKRDEYARTIERVTRPEATDA
ncbi:MAG: HigA family addiction module antitoxin [Sphingomonas sp.]